MVLIRIEKFESILLSSRELQQNELENQASRPEGSFDFYFLWMGMEENLYHLLTKGL